MSLDANRTSSRHTAAVHLLEAGVEVNVIRGWLGHADLVTTNRYAEINSRTKLAALRASELSDATEASRTKPIWRTDETPQLAGITLISYVAGFTRAHWTPGGGWYPSHLIRSATEAQTI
jgi:hypothetical protein